MHVVLWQTVHLVVCGVGCWWLLYKPQTDSAGGRDLLGKPSGTLPFRDFCAAVDAGIEAGRWHVQVLCSVWRVCLTRCRRWSRGVETLPTTRLYSPFDVILKKKKSKQFFLSIYKLGFFSDRHQIFSYTVDGVIGPTRICRCGRNDTLGWLWVVLYTFYFFKS